MEIILELFLTAFITLLFSFFITKIFSLAMGGDSASTVEEKPLTDVDDEWIIMEELEFAEKLKVQVLESEKKVEFVKESAGKVYVFEAEQARVDQGFESERKVECVQETADKVGEFEAAESEVGEVVEILKVQGFESLNEVEFLQETAEKVEGFEAEFEVKLDDIVVQKKMEKKEVGEIGEELEAENEIKLQSEEISFEESQMKGLGEGEKEVKLESDDDDDDDWEAIERSELQKVFADAAKFVDHKGVLGSLGNDVQMELYGLHKIATEGPCRQPQPLPFMRSSRSKWNAWQKLGKMNPEAAMEQYVAILSNRVPGWMEHNSDGEHKFEYADPGIPNAMSPDINSFPDQLNIFTQERNAELKSAIGGDDISESTGVDKPAKC